ncbi:MAG: Omp28-related outer membrane protein [Bacteroidetes bacterium]|nr:Omp28-related outer membrane protein [Bacteroidota bacterium]
MKSRLILCVASLVIILSGCREIGPLGLDYTAVNENLFDTTYIAATVDNPQDRIVLLEEFTGVQCVICPKAHKESARIIEENPGKVIGVAIHSGFFAKGYSGISKQKFKIKEGEAIEAMIKGLGTNGIVGYPTGMINRKGFPDEVIYKLTQWAVHVDEELLIAPDVNMSISGSLDKNNLTVRVELHFINNSTEDNYISVMILEDSIIDPQLGKLDTPGLGGIDTFYVHNNVLRDMLTPYNGFKIKHTLVPGRVVIQEFFFGDLPKEWNLNNCRIVAFVNRFKNDLEVLQAVQMDLN